MKRVRIFLTVILVLVSTVAMLSASPTAERQYTTLMNSNPDSQSLQELRKSIDTLRDTLAKEQDEAYKQLSEARMKGDGAAYRQARETLARLDSYRMTRDQSELLLGRILRLDEPQRSEYAAWLYEVSGYYKPTLTLDFSAEGENYRYSFTQRVSKEPGSEVKLPDSGSLRFNSTHLGVLAGWGLTPDEVTYQPGETITMGYTDQTLYAIYKGGIRFVDTRNNIDLQYEEGSRQVPTPVSNDPTALFAGWYDRTSGILITDPAAYEPKGKGGYFEALWKQLTIDEAKVLYYDMAKLPTNTQLGIGFAYSNTGNVNLNGLKATLSTSSRDVKLLRSELNLGRVPAGMSGTNNSRFVTSSKQPVRGESNTFRFYIDRNTPSGTVIPFTLTITSGQGDAWTHSFEVTVR